jgi:hypothetical protein
MESVQCLRMGFEVSWAILSGLGCKRKSFKIAPAGAVRSFQICRANPQRLPGVYFGFYEMHLTIELLLIVLPAIREGKSSEPAHVARFREAELSWASSMVINPSILFTNRFQSAYYFG